MEIILLSFYSANTCPEQFNKSKQEGCMNLYHSPVFKEDFANIFLP
jgi:hypothetical protein